MMNKKPHPNAEMLKAIADDWSLVNKLQRYFHGYSDYKDCSPDDLFRFPDEKYRFKPREFKEGYWYPVILPSGAPGVLKFSKGVFVSISGSYLESDFKYVGEGYLPDFGDENES